MKKTLLLTTFLLVSAILFSQKLITVSVDSATDYNSIQEAIDNASSGDIVEVLKGDYQEHIVMKDGVSLFGVNRPSISADDSATVVVMANDCFLSNFFIMNSGNNKEDCGILVNNIENGIIYNCIIAKNPISGIILQNSKCLIYQNYFISNPNIAVYTYNNVNMQLCFNVFLKNNCAVKINNQNFQGEIYNNDFVENDEAVNFNVKMSDKTVLNIFNNIFYDNSYAITRPDNFINKINFNCFFINKFDNFNSEKKSVEKIGKTNVFGDPKFNDISKFDFSIGENSSCINTGEKNTDIGRFGFYEVSTQSNLKNIHLSKNIKAKYIINLKGKAINYSANNNSADIVCVLYSDDLENFTIKGQFDNINLFGSFEMTGKAKQTSNEITTIVFDQSDVIVDYRGGFPDNYNIPFDLTLNINNGVFYGEYIVGEKLPLLTYKQKGELNFKDVKSNFKLKLLK